jgi:hypothetical protein
LAVLIRKDLVEDLQLVAVRHGKPREEPFPSCVRDVARQQKGRFFSEPRVRASFGWELLLATGRRRNYYISASCKRWHSRQMLMPSSHDVAAHDAG